MRTRTARRRTLLVSTLVVALTAACSADSSDTPNAVSANSITVAGSDEDTFDLLIDDDTIIATQDGEIPPTTTEAPLEGPDVPPAPGEVVVTVDPLPLPPGDEVERIVSMSPTHTETLFALGLGQFVVGVDEDSDFPPQVVDLRRPGLNSNNALLDPILALDPDVVILGEDFIGLAPQLNASGIPTFSGPPVSSLDEVYAQIRGIADVVARPDLGEDLITGMQREIEAIRASLPDTGGRQLTYFHEIDPSYYTFGSDSWITGFYAELGLTNITDAATAGVQLFESDVLAADPDVIILGDVECCGASIDSVGNRPGWSNMSAVRNGAVVELPDVLFSRWGPRVVDLLRLVASGVAAAS